MGMTDNIQHVETAVLQLGTVATNADSATVIDTQGKGAYCFVDAIHNVASNTSASAKWTSLVLQHGTTTDASNHTAIANMTGTTEATATTAQFVLGTHNDTTNASITRFYVNLTDKERYLRVVRQSSPSYHSTATTVTFFRKPVSPDTDALRGLASSVVG